MSKDEATPKNDAPAPAGATDWRTMHVWQIQPVRDAALIIVGLGLLYLGYQLRMVTVPLLLALLVAYTLEPLISRVTRRGIISRQGAAIGIIFGVLLIVVVPVAVGIGIGAWQGAGYAQRLATNLSNVWVSVQSPDDKRLRDRLPSERWRSLRDGLVDLKDEARRVEAEREHIKKDNGAKNGETPAIAPAPSGDAASAGAEPPTVAEAQKKPPNPAAALMYQTVEYLANQVQSNTGKLSEVFFQTSTGALMTGLDVLMTIGAIGFGGFLTAFFFFYISTNYVRVVAFLNGLLPARNRDEILRLAGRMDRAISGFVRGRLTICAIMMVYFTIAYSIIGVQVFMVVGPLVGLLTLIPYASSLGIPITMLLMFLQPGWAGWQEQWWWVVGSPIVVYAISQVMDDYFLSPRIQGPNTGMDTPTILFSSLAGGILAGFYGLLIAIPTAACLKIVLQEMVWPRFKAWREGEARDPLPLAKP